jgi:hypothetical protein
MTGARPRPRDHPVRLGPAPDAMASTDLDTNSDLARAV